MASFISYFSVIFSISFYIQVSLSFSVSHSTSRFLCHFQYLVLSTGFSVIFSTSLFLQVSLSFSVPHSTSRFLCHFQWLNLCLDMVSLVGETWSGQTYRAIDHITVSANCKLRRIFTMKSQPPDTTDDNGQFAVLRSDPNT